MPSDILVIGAGPAGLAVAACLVQRGLRPRVIEQAESVASSWRAHYERLHLHTVKTHSALPGMPFPDDYPRYVPRQGQVDYLAAYAERYRLAPGLGEKVVSIKPAADGWQIDTQSGRTYSAASVVLATGANREPKLPSFANQSQFRGRILHSRAYRNAPPFAGQRVLVVGMGNTGAEIALDLAEHGVPVSLSVRSPLNIVYRDVLGRPTQLSSLALSRLPIAWGDAVASLLRDLTVGDLSRWGIRTAAMSPLRQLREHGKTPLIDIGTVARIKSGEIKVHPGIDSFTAHSLRFTDGHTGDFDAVIFATGYEAQVNQLFPNTPLPVDANGMPTEVIGTGPLAGIYFVGFDIRSPGGLLRTIGLQAMQVADVISRAAAL